MRLFLGNRITAQQAMEMGLVTETIWPATFLEVLIPKVALLAQSSATVSFETFSVFLKSLKMSGILTRNTSK